MKTFKLICVLLATMFFFASCEQTEIIEPMDVQEEITVKNSQRIAIDPIQAPPTVKTAQGKTRGSIIHVKKDNVQESGELCLVDITRSDSETHVPEEMEEALPDGN